MVKFQGKMGKKPVTRKIPFEGKAWRNEWMDDVLCKGQAFQAERTASIQDGKRRANLAGSLAGLEPNQRLYGKRVGK